MSECENEIEYVYKYRSFNRNHLQAMFENKVWFSVSSEFNDPFDASENLVTEHVSVTNIIKFMDMYRTDGQMKYGDLLKRDGQVFIDYIHDRLKPNLISDSLNELTQLAIQNLERAYIFSTCKHWGNISMWSHYGDYHKGFCVRYDVKKLKEMGLKLRTCKPVRYLQSTVEPLDFFLDPRTESDPFVVMDEAIFRKSLDYKLEQEYRFVLEQLQRAPDESDTDFKSNSIPVEHPENAVDRIYFGCKATEFDKMQLQSLLDKRNIEYFDLKPARDGTFNLIETPL